MRRLTIGEAIFAITLVPKILNYKEPIADVDQNTINVISSSIQQPFASYAGRYLYWYLYHRAAVLFYLLIKNHPLKNGNKRTAVVLTVVFLILNKKMLSVSPDRLYDLACIVAKSEASDKDIVIKKVSIIFKKSLIDLSTEAMNKV